jgi:hypothetical protein
MKFLRNLALAFMATLALLGNVSQAREMVYADFDQQTGAFLGFSRADGSNPFALPGTAGALTDLSVIGDSRTADYSTTNGTSGRSWLAWAQAYYKQSFRVIANYGASGKRSDEYLTNGNFEKALADGSGWLIFGFPVINDLAQSLAGYVDTSGVSITEANVVDNAIARLVTKIKLARAAGKRVIALLEPGGSNLVASQVANVHEFNRKYRDALKAVPGVYVVNFNPLIWNTTSSATLIAFKTNYTGDGTHAQQMMGQALGKWFATNFLPSVMPASDLAVANISDVITNGAAQIYTNPLLTTLTGGTSSNITVTSGTVPASVVVSGSAAGLLSVVITSGANANGYGNDVTFAFTATNPVTARIDFTLPNANNWEVTDYLEAGLEYDVASSCAASIYADTILNSNIGASNVQNDAYMLQTLNSGPPSGLADTGVVLRTPRVTWQAGSTSKGFLQTRMNLVFASAGTTTCTVTVRRPFMYRYR